MKKKQEKNHLEQEERQRKFQNKKLKYKKLKINLKKPKQKINFHFNHKWHCLYMWVLHVVFVIIGNVCMLPIQQVLILGTPNHYKHGVKT